MSPSQALKIINALAKAIDRHAGKPLIAKAQPFTDKEIVSALNLAVLALERLDRRRQREANYPARMGTAWNEEEDRALLKAYKAGTTISDLANKHKRSVGAIRSRLIRFRNDL